MCTTNRRRDDPLLCAAAAGIRMPHENGSKGVKAIRLSRVNKNSPQPRYRRKENRTKPPTPSSCIQNTKPAARDYYCCWGQKHTHRHRCCCVFRLTSHNSCPCTAASRLLLLLHHTTPHTPPRKHTTRPCCLHDTNKGWCEYSVVCCRAV